jgi:hypothetical protein
MNDEHMDQAFRELQAELTVTPSPEFAAKVRARAANAPERSWFGGWRIAAASVAMLGCAAVAVVMWGGVAMTSDVAPVPAVASVETPQPAIVERPAAPVVKPATFRPARPAVVPMRATVRPDLEVLVPADQRFAVAQLLLAMRDRGARVPPLIDAEVDSEGRLPAPAAISVAPIAIQPLGPPVPGGGRER